LPEGADERILRCAQRLREADVAWPVLLGPGAEVRARAEALGVRLDGCEVRDPQRDPSLAAYAANIASGRH
jgi:phosphate acetyltransferase